MNFKVVATRGEGNYVVEYNDRFYIMDINSSRKSSLRYKYLDSILKFGYFYSFNGEIDNKTAQQIEACIKNSKPASRAAI